MSEDINIFDHCSAGDARCNFCNGTIPCSCVIPNDINYDEDDDARNSIDTLIDIAVEQERNR